jgi:bifunctional aspartokinase / homoserine dehydrogenase 1
MDASRQIVMKFGGTSVGTAARFRECASIIMQAIRQDRIIVVVSAVAGMTDLILNALKSAGKAEAEAVEQNLQAFDLVHRKLVEELFRQDGAQHGQRIVSGPASQLRDSCRALCSLGSAGSPETVDRLLALGEKASASILAGYLCELGINAQFVRAEDAIVTDDSFGNAVPDIDATRLNCAANVLSLLNRKIVPIVAGFTGATPSGQTTTLGRGGSDYSATTIGAATGSDEVWIWTDVDGVLTADPRVCQDAFTLPEINFNEAAEMAYYGAKVIHRKAIYPAMQSGFPVRIKNAFRPEIQGTLVTRSVRGTSLPHDVVTCLPQVALIALAFGEDVQPSEWLGRLLLRLGQDRIDVLLSTQSVAHSKVELIVRGEDGARVLNAIHTILRSEFAQGSLAVTSVRHDVALVAVLGRSVWNDCRNLGVAISAMAGRHIDLIALARGAGDKSICFAVPSASSTEAVRVLHRHLNEKEGFQPGFAAKSGAAPSLNDNSPFA